ncbi:MAG TPA: glycosyltransferase family 2 protein [Anaerolineales bacterium]|nr:glycosyltransferase family 2 protein [Anaerolineales bacterium]
MIYFALSTLLSIAGLIVVYWLHDQNHLDLLVEPVDPPSNAPMISVCIPARNEERHIQACVEAVLKQTYPNFEVIVLDDRSTDSTSEILRSIRNDRLEIISGADLPSGWAGKPHALYQASNRARGDWLCFIDADTFLAPEALASVYVKAFETKADLFTVMTFQITETFWERVVLPLVMTALSVGFSPRKVNDPRRRDAIANGQFILIRRSVYDAIGGHEAVKDQIVEDKAISEKVKWSGFRLIVADGRKVARTRMYTSFATLWEGWTKNIYLGLREQVGLMMLGAFGAFVSVVAALVLPLWPLLGLVWLLHNGGWMAITIIIEALILWSAVIYVRAVVAHNLHIPRWYALTTPLGAAIFAALMFTSTWKVISGQGVTWRGRKYKSAK